MSAVRILCVGDSITVGASSASGGYRGRLEARLRDLGHTPTMLMAAEGGMTLDRVRPLVDAAIASGPPDIALWALGTNDWKWPPGGTLGGWPERYRDEIRRVLDMLPDSHAAVATVPRQPAHAGLFTNCNVWVRNNTTAPLGARAKVCELESLPTVFLIDGTHPADAGYSLIADLWLHTIRGWL